MKLYRIALAFLAVSLLVACKKSISPNSIDFGVNVFNNAGTQTLKFKVNDTINFRFSGNPDRISFFSGEIGRRYAFRNRTSDPSPNDTLRFFTNQGTPRTAKLELLVSSGPIDYTQYNAKDSLSVPAAKWTDISDRVKNWATGPSNVQSAPISLNEEASTGSGIIWLAFKYTAPAGVAQSTWTVGGIDLRHHVKDTFYTILTPAIVIPASLPGYTTSPGWGSVNVANPLIKWGFNGGSAGNTAIGQSLSSNGSTGSFVIRGNTTATSAVATEGWMVAGPIDLKRVLPDAGVGIKNKGENAMLISKGFYASRTANFTYRFPRAGIYEITFLAQNDTESDQNTLVKTITVEITN